MSYADPDAPFVIDHATIRMPLRSGSEACPDINLPEFLRQAGIRAAADE
jgi:hypothetical protein